MMDSLLREFLRKYMKDWLKENKPDGSQYNIYVDGLKILPLYSVHAAIC